MILKTYLLGVLTQAFRHADWESSGVAQGWVRMWPFLSAEVGREVGRFLSWRNCLTSAPVKTPQADSTFPLVREGTCPSAATVQ